MTAVQKISAWGVLFVLFMWGVFELRDILLPFVAGMCIAYFLDPVTTKLQKYFHSRMAALIVVSAVLILLAQRIDCIGARAQWTADAQYLTDLKELCDKGLEIICCGCSVSLQGIWVTARLPFTF